MDEQRQADLFHEFHPICGVRANPLFSAAAGEAANSSSSSSRLQPQRTKYGDEQEDPIAPQTSVRCCCEVPESAETRQQMVDSGHTDSHSRGAAQRRSSDLCAEYIHSPFRV
jgi:hypothetical protein